MGERARVTAQHEGEVDRPVALLWVVGQEAHQVVHGFAGTERPHRHDLRLGLAGDSVLAGCGDQDPARRAARPQTVQVRRIPQVIEHHQPGPGGLGHPAGEAGGHLPGRAGRIDAHGRRSLDIAGQHRGPAAGINPGQQVHLAAAP